MSDDNGELIKDITKARARVKHTLRDWENSKFQTRKAKEIYEGAVLALDELVAELVGEIARPLFNQPKKADPEDHPWQECPLIEVLGLLDDAAGREDDDADLVLDIAEELEVEDGVKPTLGHLAEWLQVNELETFVKEGILGGMEVELLRAALLKAKSKFGWPDSIDEDSQGIPLAAIEKVEEPREPEPEPKADVVVNTMAAAKPKPKAKKTKKSA